MGKIKAIIKTSAVTTGVMYFVNKLIESNLTASINTKTGGKYYHWKHGNIYYNKTGNGHPLLLIHDLNAFASHYEWTEVTEKLSVNHTVYTLDLIGCGKSDKPSITYTNYFYVQLVRDFIKEVIGEKTDVIASGISSSFVIMANAADDSLFDSITMINPKSIKRLKQIPDQHSKFLLKLFQLPVLGKFLYYVAANKSNIDYYLTETCFYSPFKVTPAVSKSYYDASHASFGSGKALFASLKGNYLNIDISKALAKMENRVILLTGDQLENKEETVASYLKLNKNILPFSVEKSKLFPQLEEPKQTLEYILSAL